nr:odorant receptor 52 [Graphosoma rubrolineatum]
MAKIKLDVIEEASRKIRLLLSLANIILSYKIHSLTTFVNSTLACCVLAYSIYHFRNSPEDLAGAAYNLGACASVPVACVSGYLAPVTLRNIVDGSCSSYDYRSSIMREKLNEVENRRAETLKGFFKTIEYLIYYSTFNLLGLTALLGIIQREVVYLFPCWSPFDQNNFFWQITILLWQVYLIISMTFMAFGGGVLFYISYSHIKSEVALLKCALVTVEERAHEMAKSIKSSQGESYTRILSLCYRECIRMCAQHHSEIIGYFNDGKYITGIYYSSGFLCGGVACTFSAYFIVSDNFALKVRYLGMTLLLLGYLFVLFDIAEETTNELLTVAETASTIEWYKLPKECHSTLRFMLLRSCEPMFYKLLLGQRVGKEAYMALVRATYYYLNMMTA